MTEKKITVAVIGGGISGLSTAYYLKRKASEGGVPLDIAVYEAENRLGGKIITEKRHGFICEGGPNGFLDNKTGMLNLTREIGLEEELFPSSEEASKRYLLCNGRLQRIPESPPAFFMSPILSLWGKMRVAAEIFTKRPPGGVDETIAEFGRRHIGAEAVEKFLDPMVTGIFGGDVHALSLRSCFPRMAELEERNGSLIRAMINLQKQKKKAGESKKTGPSGPGGKLYSFTDGMETVIHKLAEIVGEGVHTSTPLSNVAEVKEDDKPKYKLSFGENGGNSIIADIVILAIPAFSAKSVLKQFDLELAGETGEIPYAPMAVICAGFSGASIENPLDGFGFLVPRREGRKLLGSLWCSKIFDNRAPGGSVLLRNMLGGSRDIKTPFLDDDELIGIAIEELRPILQIKGKPAFARIFRWRNAIPQYVVGHGARVQRIRDILRVRHPGFFITGNAYLGVAMNDCVENASKIADNVLEFVNEKHGR